LDKAPRCFSSPSAKVTAKGLCPALAGIGREKEMKFIALFLLLSYQK